MNKFYLSLVVAGIFTGCGFKAPDPVKLDSKAISSISHDLVSKRIKSVPKDELLSKSEWLYSEIVFKQADGELLKNDEVVKTFFLAHNSSKIIIVGKENLANEYAKYFKENDVTATIEIQPANFEADKENMVNLLFFNKLSKDKR